MDWFKAAVLAGIVLMISLNAADASEVTTTVPNICMEFRQPQYELCQDGVCDESPCWDGTADIYGTVQYREYNPLQLSTAAAFLGVFMYAAILFCLGLLIIAVILGVSSKWLGIWS